MRYSRPEDVRVGDLVIVEEHIAVFSSALGIVLAPKSEFKGDGSRAVLWIHPRHRWETDLCFEHDEMARIA
jgi:hypothetical protein